MVCRGRNHGAQRDGCDAMRWDGESQTPKGLDGAPPKGELGTWGRVQQLAEGPGPGPGLQQSHSRKPPRKSNGAKTAVQCGCALAAVSIDKTARHPSPKAPKRTRRFTVHALGKRGWPVPSVEGFGQPQMDAPTARPNRRRDAVPQSGPCFFPGCGMATCPQCAAACMHTEQGFVLREPVMEKAIQTPAQVPLGSLT